VEFGELTRALSRRTWAWGSWTPPADGNPSARADVKSSLGKRGQAAPAWAARGGTTAACIAAGLAVSRAFVVSRSRKDVFSYCGCPSGCWRRPGTGWLLPVRRGHRHSPVPIHACRLTATLSEAADALRKSRTVY